MAIFSSTQPSIRARVLPRFPANVIAGTGMSITKSGGTYAFATLPIAGLPVTSLQNIPTDTILGRDSVGLGPVEVLTVSGGLGIAAGQLQLTQNQRIRGLPFVLGGVGASITTGIKGDMFVPYACTIQQITLLADVAATATSFVLDIWKVPYASYPPLIANTITGTSLPTINVGASKGQLVLSPTPPAGWIVSVAAGDTLRFNVSTAAGSITRIYIGIDVLTL